MVFIGLIFKYICSCITTEKIPSNVINVSKHDLLDHISLKRIEFGYGNIIGVNLTDSSIDLSKLEYLSKLIYAKILQVNFYTS